MIAAWSSFGRKSTFPVSHALRRSQRGGTGLLPSVEGGDMEQLTNETVELLQTMIRNQCVNDGTAESGQEERNADTLVNFIEGAGLDVEVYDAAPGRRSMVARIEGSDPAAPSLCLMGHTDVVPVNPNGWSRDPFGG